MTMRRITDDSGAVAETVQDDLRTDLMDWRAAHPRQDGRPAAISDVATRIGVSSGTLSDWIARKYAGDGGGVARKIDLFLGEEAERAARPNVRQFAPTRIAKEMLGVINIAVRGNRMVAIIAEPGTGKTEVALAFQRERGSCIYVRADDAFGDARGISALLCADVPELKEAAGLPHRKRVLALRSFVQRRRNYVLIVDEVQNLTRDGLELIRALHDLSDLQNHRCLPVVLLGDKGFFRLLLKARNGERCVVSPQLVRRIAPVYDATRDGVDSDGDLYSVEDIRAILRNSRLKLVTPAGERWLTRLSNVEGWGRLGLAMRVCELALDVRRKRPLDVADLHMAHKMLLGPDLSTECAEQAGGELAAATA